MKRQRFIYRVVMPAILLCLTALMISCQNQDSFKVTNRSRELMGTTVSIQTFTSSQNDPESAIAEAFERIINLEKQAHPKWKTSAVYLLNASAGDEPIELPPDIFAVLKLAHDVSQHSAGAFDVTFAGIGGLYNFSDPDAPLPTDEQLDERLRLVDYQKLFLNEQAHTAQLLETEMQVNLGGIAKGWATDVAMQVLQAHGIDNAIVNAGGDMTVRGNKNGKPWRVGVQHPRRSRGELYAVLQISDDVSVATSGDYERYRINNGKRIHHILNPQTGRPSDRSQSVTILAPSGALADALATAVFVMGPEEGLAMLREYYPQCDALILDGQTRQYISENFIARTNMQKVDSE